MVKPSKQQIAAVRSALREIHAELLAWDPHVLVSLNDKRQKAQIIARMSLLGWHYVDDPSNETADVSMIEFRLDAISHTPTPQSAARGSGRIRRFRFPAPFFASFGVIFAIVGIIGAAAFFFTDHRMRLLENAGSVTNGEIERTYFERSRFGPRTYHVSYRFVDEHGISHRAEDAYPLPDWNSLRPGDPISVTYLSDDPEESNLTQRVRLITGSSQNEVIIGIGILWTIAGCMFLVAWSRRRRP